MADEHLPVATGLCNTCRFWFNGLSDFEDIAECRRMPPVRSEQYTKGMYSLPPNKGEIRHLAGRGFWPITDRFGSCGEYSARKDGAAKIWDMGE